MKYKKWLLLGLGSMGSAFLIGIYTPTLGFLTVGTGSMISIVAIVLGEE